jgi:hypothetical protein
MIRTRLAKVGIDHLLTYLVKGTLDVLPPTRLAKKHDDDSTSSSKRDESPILKKASVSLRSKLLIFLSF